MGERINDESSVLYWCWKNNIPVFNPAFTDGGLGDCFLEYERTVEKGFRCDLIEDAMRIYELAESAKKAGQILLGGGVSKHHIMNANWIRDGADFSVFVNTTAEFDSSDSGASPEEAKSWGKIKKDANPVKVFADATLVFPIIVGETFVTNFETAKRT